MAENTPEQWYKNLPLLTRIGLTTVFVFTILAQIEILNPRLIILDWTLVINKLQVWRLFTATMYFGPLGFPFLFQMYFFTSFSSKLEKNEVFAQPGDYLFFLLFQMLLLCVISLVLAWPAGFPLLGPAMVFSILYYWSRREPYAILNFFSFNIKGFQFPFALLFFQLLMGGNVWMDIVGLAAGHIYYFITDVVPQEYGYSILKTPQFMNTFMAKYQPSAGGAAGGAAAPRPPPQPFGGGGQRLGGN
eukprot:TRINITY_DN20256_c0_g6_i1.p1 TRINITY_DN20256_c0_g6~~TRINITY_DN20256_c0_g6_i1.p1  ORF type:complete len:272 (-),score=43.23 TRINITY_DN20256_c0_g6_i1:139-876(-)